MVADYIYNQRFEHNIDFYVDEEFGQDGELIYSTPPLYDVWLDEPERRYRKEKLTRQQQITENREG